MFVIRPTARGICTGPRILEHLFYHFAKHAEVISLDHDFGDDVDFDGYKVACQLERLAATTVGGIRKDVQILSHSQNPEGRARIEAAARSIKRILEQAP